MKQIETALKNFAEEFELAIRIAMLIVALSFGMLVLLVGVTSASAATLRGEGVVTDDYIRLGDIFDGVKNAEYVLGPAPQPGKDMILNARTLYKIAAALDVEWQPSTSAEQIILRREAVVVPQADVTAALQEKLRESGVKDSFSVTYTNTLNDIILPAGLDRALEVTAFNFDAQNDTFNAVVVSPSADNPVKRVPVSGRIERLVQVPVLKSTLRNGDIIGALDIDYIELPAFKLSNGTLLKEEDIVNMTPRRVTAAGKPLISNDLEQPKMVERGDVITLVFADGPMQLTVKGKSLQAGAMGDTIRVSNTDSNKNLQGTVTAHREVTIR